VVGCYRVGFQAAVPAPVRTSRTVRVVGADRPRGGFCPGVLRVLRMFLSVVVFDSVGQWLLVESGLADSPQGRRGQSARHELLADRPRTWYRPSARGGSGWVVLLVFNGLSAVWCGPSTWWSRTVRPRAADRPPGLLQIS
jgi:hypothetical protein